MNARDPRQLEQEESVGSDLAGSLRLSVLAVTINAGFFGELPGKVATFLTEVSTGGYLVTTDVLGGTTFEGVVAGGVTFLVTKGGSKLLR